MSDLFYFCFSQDWITTRIRLFYIWTVTCTLGTCSCNSSSRQRAINAVFNEVKYSWKTIYENVFILFYVKTVRRPLSWKKEISLTVWRWQVRTGFLACTTLNRIYSFYVYNISGSHSVRTRDTRYVYFFIRACFHFILISSFFRNLIEGITIPRTCFYRWRGKTVSYA